MCGICGKVLFDPDAAVSQPLLRAMTDTIRHRGPDDQGFYLSGPVGLGFRRLSIIDLDGGHQPISNEDGTIWIVFNGEIYNFQSLREELMKKGHIFKTHSDTEVIVHLYEDYGAGCVDHLRGMFAFALWDNPNKTLLLARDRIGIKPLYYYLGSTFLSFGSEMKAILADPEVTRDVDVSMIDRFLRYFYVPGGQTLLQNLFKLEPGHVLVLKDNHYKTWRYWDLAFCETNGRDRHGAAALEEELLALLEETVECHMISDVPIGFLLSGGIDSTALLSLAAAKSSKPISTFTIGFSSESVIDERPFARLAAERFGTTHYEMSISPNQFSEFLPQYVWHMEEPVCQPPAIALYYISKLAREHVKVLISGEGGDEAFAGYETYRNNFWFERFKSLLGPVRGLVRRSSSLLSNMVHSRVLDKYGPRVDTPFEQYYLSRTSSPFDYFAQNICDLYSDEMAANTDEEYSLSVTQEYLARAKDYSVFDKMLYVDINTWLPDELLIKADKMTMANSVELRVPLLDHKVLEFAARLPRNQKVRGWTMKYLLKRALRNRVPTEILQRRKAGFPVPYGKWLRGNLRGYVSDVLLGDKAMSRGYFKRSAIENLISLDRKGRDYSREIFSLLVLELWHGAFAD
jgi:asparagine synthase (glutamine-hydrolysing)